MLFCLVEIQNVVSGFLEMNPSNNHALALQELINQLNTERAWLLEQIDRGRWPEFRLDLAALERELGQLLTRASDQLEDGNKLRK